MESAEKLKKQQCRTCYDSTKGLKLLKTLTKCAGSQQQKSYAELLKEVSNINIMEDSYSDQLPQLICKSCTRRLKASHAFIQQCREVNERLITIAGKVETEKLVTCLQEPAVDVLPTDDIKSEKDDGEMDYLGVFEPQCFVVLKVEEPEHSLPIDNTSEDVLSLKQHEEPLIEIKKLSENVESKDNNVTKPASIENLDFSNDEEDNHSDSDTDWKEEDEEFNSTNVTKDKKKNNPKYKKSSHDADKDIAVPCSECNKIFSNSKALASHKRNTHIPEEKKCTCPLCGRRFSRSCNMYKHMRTFHGPDSVPLLRKPSTKERMFQCDKCERSYTKKSHLNVHIREKHTNEGNKTENKSQQSECSEMKTTGDDAEIKEKTKKRYEVRSLCSICGSSFASRTHLVVHMRRHTGERPFKCDLCERAYPRLSELVCHRRIHTGEKPFKCKICDKAFRVWSKMSNHMRSHTDIRPYKCKQCERSFKYSKDLNIHFRIHTGERPYKCNVCGSTFTQSNTLKAHRSKLGHMDDGAMIVKNNI